MFVFGKNVGFFAQVSQLASRVLSLCWLRWRVAGRREMLSSMKYGVIEDDSCHSFPRAHLRQTTRPNKKKSLFFVLNFKQGQTKNLLVFYYFWDSISKMLSKFKQGQTNDFLIFLYFDISLELFLKSKKKNLTKILSRISSANFHYITELNWHGARPVR